MSDECSNRDVQEIIATGSEFEIEGGAKSLNVEEMVVDSQARGDRLERQIQ